MDNRTWTLTVPAADGTPEKSYDLSPKEFRAALAALMSGHPVAFADAPADDAVEYEPLKIAA